MQRRTYCAACAISLSLAVMVLSGCEILTGAVERPTPSPAPTNDAMMNKNGTEMLQNTNAMMDGDGMMNRNTNVAPAPTPTPAPAAQSSYIPFTKSAYEQARAAGRPIMLYFYANWCPLCRPQEPVIQELFASGQIADWGVAAFRVNYEDSDTDADERAMKQQFGITYQHTFVFLDKNGKEASKFIGTRTAAQLKAELEKIR